MSAPASGVSPETGPQGTLGSLATEVADSRYADIDRLPVAELAALMNEADSTVPIAVSQALPDITAAIEAITARMKAGGRLVYVGAGTPGRIGVLDASEAPPTFGTPPSQVFGIIAGGPGAIVSPVEGAEDDPAAGAAAIDESLIGPLDSVVGIASSGRTPFVIGAIERARQLGALTVGLSCNEHTPLSAAAECPIEVLVGPEVVAGSTRLKAGTAQKLVLNMISTIVMVQLGKTYGNLMVDVRASNDKLRDRATRIAATVAGVDHEVARATLEHAGWSVKLAAIQLRLGLTLDEARERLGAADGRLRQALEVQE